MQGGHSSARLSVKARRRSAVSAAVLGLLGLAFWLSFRRSDTTLSGATVGAAGSRESPLDRGVLVDDPATQTSLREEMPLQRAGSEVEISASPAGPRDCLVQIRSLGSVPVPGASILDRERGVLLGKSDENGQAEVSLERDHDARLLVTHQEYVGRLFGVPREQTSPITVNLVPSWSIDGIVLKPGGLPAGAGLLVLAAGPNQALEHDAIALAVSGVPAIPMARTDEGGGFRLVGLDSQKGYHLFVGGAGLIAFDPFEPAIFSTDDQPVRIRTRAVYGAVIALREVGGGPLRLGSELDGPWFGSPAALARDAKPVFLSSDGPLLLGLTHSGSSMARHEREILFSLPDLVDGIDVSFDVSVPGYERRAGMIYCPRLLNDLEIKPVELSPDAPGFGDIVVRVDDRELAKRVLVSTEMNPGMILHLVDVRQSSVLETRLARLLTGEQVIRGVPFGSYHAHVEGPHGFFEVEYPGSLVVSESPATFDLPLTGLGAMELTLETGAGGTYAGPLLGSLVHSLGREAIDFHFWRPPYFIPVLPPGRWEVSINGFVIVEPAAERPFVVTVRAGEAADAHFVVE